MKTFSRIAMTSALALALATPAFAQSSSTSPSTEATESTMPKTDDTGSSDTGSSMSTGSSAQSETSTSAGAAATASAGEVIAEQQSGQTLSSELVGMKVIGADDESIGEVSNLIMEDGQVTGAILDVGGFLGLGAKKIGVPWDALSVTEVEGSMVATLPLSKDQLSNMPEFKTLAEVKAEQSRSTTTGTTGGTSTQ